MSTQPTGTEDRTEKPGPDLRRQARNTMRALLGSGYVDSYYDAAASDFVGLAEWWASVENARLLAELDDTRAQLAVARAGEERLRTVGDDLAEAVARLHDTEQALEAANRENDRLKSTLHGARQEVEKSYQNALNDTRAQWEHAAAKARRCCTNCPCYPERPEWVLNAGTPEATEPPKEQKQ